MRPIFLVLRVVFMDRFNGNDFDRDTKENVNHVLVLLPPSLHADVVVSLSAVNSSAHTFRQKPFCERHIIAFIELLFVSAEWLSWLKSSGSNRIRLFFMCENVFPHRESLFSWLWCHSLKAFLHLMWSSRVLESWIRAWVECVMAEDWWAELLVLLVDGEASLGAADVKHDADTFTTARQKPRKKNIHVWDNSQTFYC